MNLVTTNKKGVLENNSCKKLGEVFSCHTDTTLYHEGDNGENMNDLKEQLGVLMEAMQILTEIITKTDKNNIKNSSNNLTSEYYDIHDVHNKRMEELQNTWKLEETAFSRLFNACQQMRDTLHLTSLEADEALRDAQRSNEIVIAAKVEEEEMKNKILELTKENMDLQKKNDTLMDELRKQKKEKKLIARYVRNFLDMKRKDKNDETSLHCDTTTSSSDNIKNSQSFSSYPYSPTTSASTSGEWEDISPVSSSSCLVTDDGCATVRFPLKQVRNRRRCKGEGDKKFRQRNLSELSFPSKDTGLQFSAVPVKSSRNKKNDDEALLLVCGYLGFNYKLNKRPTFGSRLVSIDGISLDGGDEKWNMEKFVDYICEKKCGPLQMTFRSDLLSTSQIQQLKRDGRSR